MSATRSRRRRRLIFVAASGISAALLVACSAEGGGTGASMTPTPPLTPNPRCETLPVGPQGQPGPIVVCQPPEDPNPRPPEIVGPFRLRSFGWIDPTPTPQTIGTPDMRPFAETGNLATLRAAPFYAEPGYLPTGYTFERAGGTLRGADVESYEITYRGPDGLAGC